MQLSEREQYIIERYQEDEAMMVLLFAQWCVNNDINPHELYKKAYPHQMKNDALDKALEQTVSKEKSEYISKNIIVSLLQIFGNDDLAFEVAQIEEKDEKK